MDYESTIISLLAEPIIQSLNSKECNCNNKNENGDSSLNTLEHNKSYTIVVR